MFHVANRLVECFRFALGNLRLRPLNPGHRTDWEWSDESGVLIARDKTPGLLIAHFPGLPGTRLAYGSQALKPSQKPALTQYLTGNAAPDAIDSIRTSARDALLLGNMHVAVLNLAIFAEVIVKTFYFRRDPVSAEAYDALEEVRHVSTPPIELVNKIAQRALGERFDARHPKESQYLDELFQCRNEVAHREVLQFREKSGRAWTSTDDTVRSWWQAVEVLTSWLNAIIPITSAAPPAPPPEAGAAAPIA